MTTIRRSEKQLKALRISKIAGPLIVAWGMWKTYLGFEEGIPETLLEWTLPLDGAMWLFIGTAILFMARRMLRLPAAEFDERAITIYSSSLGFKVIEQTIARSAIARVQKREPGVCEIYFAGATGDTCSTLTGRPDDVELFERSLKPRAANP